MIVNEGAYKNRENQIKLKAVFIVLYIEVS